MGKSIWTSKTFWVNVVAMVGMIIQGITGKELLNLEIQAGILSGVNILLRLITKSPITWS